MSATVSKVLVKVFGSRNERLLKRYRRIVDQIPLIGADGHLAKEAAVLEFPPGRLRQLGRPGKMRGGACGQLRARGA